MNTTGKLTPIQVLEKRKNCLQTQLEALTDNLEENFTYLQNNFASLLSDAAVGTVIDRLPPFVQRLFGNGERDNPPTTASRPINYKKLIDNTLDIIPLFLKGKKGAIMTLILKQISHFVMDLSLRSSAE
jgi:hypothetical protein